MKHRAKYAVGFLIVVLAFLSPHILQAQGQLTLEGLSERIDTLFQFHHGTRNRIAALETSVAAIETNIDPSLTPQPTRTTIPTPNATATARVQARANPTATSRPTRRPTRRPPTATPASLSVSARDIFDDYDSNLLAAERKYEGVTLRVHGRADNIIRTFGRYTLHIDAGRLISSVGCQLASGQEDTLIEVAEGEQVTVQGIGDGKFMGNFYIKNCVIVEYQ
ncbi:MAG: hypothetical protein OXK78_05555 [Caldilineaceae bacterium]|nr:hypothetical protein [Caldilineaceae bacterium]